MMDELPSRWSNQFGLALSPLFEDSERTDANQHHVLLDGGNGTFALSTVEYDLWHEDDAPGWIWSSDIAHHVTVTSSKVVVLRWDQPKQPQPFSRSSVERSLDKFYRFLSDDRLRSNKSVIDHLLSLFRRIRSLVFNAQLPDGRTTDLFLLTLADLIDARVSKPDPSRWGIAEDALELRSRLHKIGLAAAEDEVRHARGSLDALQLYPALALRHAGGQLFQEAHFELLRVPPIDLFGEVGPAETKDPTRGVAHFTPPALARIIIEHVLGAIGDITKRTELTICDPACGSGAFLHESLRALRRVGFSGRLTLVGIDISRPALAMARFVVFASLRDWSPAGGVRCEFMNRDSLEPGSIPAADIVVMNPPFISSGAQTPHQRTQLQRSLGKSIGRADISMAFFVEAMNALKSGGILGGLFPASLLSLGAASEWRSHLSKAGTIKLLASIGDYGLFAHAMVQVAFLVIQKIHAVKNSELTALVSTNDSVATGDALRWLRKIGPDSPSIPVVEQNWSIFALSHLALDRRATWRFPSPRSESVLRALAEAQLPSIGNLFEVKRGIETGLNDVLLLTPDELAALPKQERAFFRAVTMSDSINGGKITKPYFVFFPHTTSGLIFGSESELKASVPVYYSKSLLPNKDRLSNRADIRHLHRPWWILTRPRTAAFNRKPRILSKYFSAEGGFAGDFEAKFYPVMGFAWFANRSLEPDSESDLPIENILAAYVGLFNSAPFVNLLEICAPHVAGGQFDLSPRFVETIPVPNLREACLDPQRGTLVRRLATSGRAVDLSDLNWQKLNNQLVAELYGAKILAGLK